MRAALLVIVALLLVGCAAAGTASQAATTEQPSVQPPSEPSTSASAACPCHGPSLPSPSTGATPEPLPAATPMASATSQPPFLIAIGDQSVTLVDDLRVRSKPWVGEDSLKYVPTLAAGTRIRVVDGPVFGSGYWWYLVEPFTVIVDGDGASLSPMVSGAGILRGWVASADHDGTPWIDPGGCNVDLDPNAPSLAPGDLPC